MPLPSRKLCLPIKCLHAHPPSALPCLRPTRPPNQVGIVSYGTDLPETASEEEVLKVGWGARFEAPWLF